jgi:hypothetical protein
LLADADRRVDLVRRQVQAGDVGGSIEIATSKDERRLARGREEFEEHYRRHRQQAQGVQAVGDVEAA